MDQSYSSGRSLDRFGSPPDASGERGLFSWVKNAFSAPLNASRSNSPFQGDRERQAHRLADRASPAPPAAPAAVPRDPPAMASPPTREMQRMSSTLSFESSSVGQVSVTDDGDGEDDEGDSDDEVYVPYKPSSPPSPQLENINLREDGPAPALVPSASTSVPGLVRPMARRSVSIHYGKNDASAGKTGGLASQGETMKQAQGHKEGEMSRSSSVMTGDSSPASSILSRPSLMLTPPDSNEAQEIQSPPVADFPPQSPEDQDAHTVDRSAPNFGAILGRSYSLESNLNAEGEVKEAAVDVQSRETKEAVLMGSRTAQLRDRESSGESGSGPVAEARRREDWDESRARTPKAFADLHGVSSRDTGSTVGEPLPSPREAAEEIAGTGGPTPKPFWAHSSPKLSPQHVRPTAIKPSPSPAAGNPPLRRLFGRRRIESLSGSKLSGDDSTTSHEGPSWGTRSRESSKGGTPSATPSFWRLGRKVSASENGPSPAASDRAAHRHSVASSVSSASGFSIDVPQSRAGSSIAGGSRPSSIIVPSEVSHGSRGKTTRVKIRAGVGLQGSAGPRKTKSRSKNKTGFDLHFNKLYLAQELHIGSEASHVGVAESVSSSSLSNTPLVEEPEPRGSSSRSELSTLESQQSMASASTMSHGTVGSFGSFSAHDRKATWAMKFSLDGRYLATAGQDRVIRVFEVLDTEEKRHAEVAFLKAREDARRPSNAPSASSYDDGSSASSRRSRSADSTSDRRSISPVPIFSSRPVCEFRGHTSDVLSLDWSKGNFLLSSSMDKTVRVWHLSRPASSLVSFVHGDFVCSAVFHKDDRFFLSGSLDGKLRLWNIAARKVHAVVDVPGLITAVAFSSSGEWAIAGTFSGALLFYKTDDLSYQSSIAVRRSAGKYARGTKITGIEAIPPLGGASSGAGSTAPGRADEKILITSNDSRIRIYSLTDRRLTAKYKGSTYLNRTSQIRAHTFDDRFVVAGSESGEVYVWDWTRKSRGEQQQQQQQSEQGGREQEGRGAGGGGATYTDGGAAPASSQTYECWTAADGARPITVSLLAPLKTHTHLATGGDPIELAAASAAAATAANVGARVKLTANGATVAAVASPSSRTGSSSDTMVSADGAGAGAGAGGAKGSTKAAGAGAVAVAEANATQNRIVLSVDESQVVRVWRGVTSSVEYHLALARSRR